MLNIGCKDRHYFPNLQIFSPNFFYEPDNVILMKTLTNEHDKITSKQIRL